MNTICLIPRSISYICIIYAPKAFALLKKKVMKKLRNLGGFVPAQ